MTKIKGGIALALVVSLAAGVPRSALAAGPEASQPQSPADAASSDGAATGAAPHDEVRRERFVGECGGGILDQLREHFRRPLGHLYQGDVHSRKRW